MMHEDHSGAADEAQAFATLLVVSMFFFFAEENEKSPQFQEDGVEAVQSPPPPGARLRCCGAESGCTLAAARHGDGCGDQGDGVRPGSATDVQARLVRSLC